MLKVWYKLDSSPPGRVEVRVGASVVDLKKAVKAEWGGRLACAAWELTIFAAGADSITSTPLEPCDPIPTDTTCPNPLIVVAPKQQQREGDLDLSKLIRNKLVEARRENLEAGEKSTKLPQQVEERNAVDLGKYLKFVNRKESINELLKHAAEQFFLYRTDEGIGEHRAQFAACSGGRGLGKTTFCRKAFTTAADTKKGPLWDGVKDKDSFFRVVETCVNTGRQYRITFGGGTIATEDDYQAPSTSLAYRLTAIITKQKHPFPDGNGSIQLYRVLCQITGGDPEAMVVIHFDETNMVMAFKQGQNYLRQVLAAVQEFNRHCKGFVFCILSGTNVRPLHDLLKLSSRGNLPKEIRLPLLRISDVYDVLKDLLEQSNPDQVEISQGCKEELDFVAQVLGGVPRYIEMLIYSMGEQPEKRMFALKVYGETLSSNGINPHKLLERVKELINGRYGWTFREMVQGLPCRTLVSYSLFRWTIRRADTVRGGQAIGDLETNGVVFVNKDGTLMFPLVLLLNLAKAGHSPHLPMLLQKFDIMLSSDNNERNTLGIFAMKCIALSENDEPITLESLFPLEKFPHITRRVKATEMSFDRFELKRAKSKIEKRSWNMWLPVLAERGCFLLNCKGATFADMIMVSKGTGFAVFFQEKQREVAKEQAHKRRKVPTLSYETVRKEHDKCDVGTPHLFAIVTDELFDDFDHLSENEIVLSSELHSAAIGPLLALLRRHNHAHQPEMMSL